MNDSSTRERVNEYSYADVRLHAKLAISDANRSQVDHFGTLFVAFRTLFATLCTQIYIHFKYIYIIQVLLIFYIH